MYIGIDIYFVKFCSCGYDCGLGEELENSLLHELLGKEQDSEMERESRYFRGLLNGVLAPLLSYSVIQSCTVI